MIQTVCTLQAALDQFYDSTGNSPSVLAQCSGTGEKDSPLLVSALYQGEGWLSWWCLWEGKRGYCQVLSSRGGGGGGGGGGTLCKLLSGGVPLAL